MALHYPEEWKFEEEIGVDIPSGVVYDLLELIDRIAADEA